MICLDSNAVIVMLNDGDSPVTAAVARAVGEGRRLVLSSIVLHELWYGAAKSGRVEHNKQRLRELVPTPFEMLDFDAEDAREAGEIRAALARAGTPIGPYDVMIAAQARRRGATLVTANLREFKRIPGLRLEDWSAA